MEALLPQITRHLHGKLQCASPNVRERSPPGEPPPQSERDYSSDTKLGNRAGVVKPIEITDRVILVCHHLI